MKIYYKFALSGRLKRMLHSFKKTEQWNLKRMSRGKKQLRKMFSVKTNKHGHQMNVSNGGHGGQIRGWRKYSQFVKIDGPRACQGTLKTITKVKNRS